MLALIRSSHLPCNLILKLLPAYFRSKDLFTLVSESSGPNSKPSYLCNLCGKKSTTDPFRHSTSAAHQERVAKYFAEQEEDNLILNAQSQEQLEPPLNLEWPQDLLSDSSSKDSTPTGGLDVHGKSMLDVLDLLGANSSGDDESVGSQSDFGGEAFNLLLNALDGMDDEDLDEEDEAEAERVLDRELAEANQQEARDWFPFKKKSMLLECWQLGHLEIYYHALSTTKSAYYFGSVMLRFQTGVLLTGSRKWLEGYEKEIRPQMVTSTIGHIYIYEIYQLFSNQLVVPTHFFKKDGKLFSKCLQARVVPKDRNRNTFMIVISDEPPFDSSLLHPVEISSFWRDFDHVVFNNKGLLKDFCKSKPNGYVSLPLVNPWRLKAKGKVIKHTPINLYSDDTSGNVSNKYNRHMNVLFSLSGLPPEILNQEYNVHFLATSNCASAPELLDHVVDEINDLSVEGFEVYDHASGDNVLVLVVVLCYLGDSPMHAEICNTTNPANTLTPCRMCDLHVDTMAEKKTEEYVRHFVGLDLDSEHSGLSKRDWDDTRSKTKEIWKIAQAPHSKGLVERKARMYGIHDTLNEFFQKKIQSAYERNDGDVVKKYVKSFNGHLDTPVEILHVVLLGIVKYLFRDEMKMIGSMKTGTEKYAELSACWRSFNTKGLKIPPIQPNTLIQFSNSLIGKEFRVVLQTVPFVFFKYISPAKRHIWISLCLLTSYIFQTEISNMATYLTELRSRIDIFLINLIGINARWVNKPIFHMLTHLPESIQCYGPAPLVGTEPFESFNGVTRKASIFTSKSAFYDQELDALTTAGPELTSHLLNNAEIQHSLGRNLKVEKEHDFIAGKMLSSHSIPSHLLNSHPHISWKQIDSLTLTNCQKVEKDDFLLMKEHVRIGQVQSIWIPKDSAASKSLVLMKKCKRGGVVEFYGMREIVISEHEVWMKPKDIECILNVQHNCHEALCSPIHDQHRRVERQTAKTFPNARICHTELNSYILNAAALYNAESHRKASELECLSPTPEEWDEAIEKGIAVLESEPVKPRAKRKQQDPSKDVEGFQESRRLHPNYHSEVMAPFKPVKIPQKGKHPPPPKASTSQRRSTHGGKQSKTKHSKEQSHPASSQPSEIGASLDAINHPLDSHISGLDDHHSDKSDTGSLALLNEDVDEDGKIDEEYLNRNSDGNESNEESNEDESMKKVQVVDSNERGKEVRDDPINQSPIKNQLQSPSPNQEQEKQQSTSLFTSIIQECGCDLDEAHLEMAQGLGQPTDQPEQAIQHGIYLAFLHQELLVNRDRVQETITKKFNDLKEEISNLFKEQQESSESGEESHPHSSRNQRSSSEPWKASDQLKALTKSFSCQHVIFPDIEAYTALKTCKPKAIQLHNCLYWLIRRSILSQGPDWTAKHLPKKVPGGLVLASNQQKFVSFIKDKGKRAREKLHAAVKAISPPQGKTRTAKALYKDTDIVTRTRYAYLDKKLSIWSVVDKQLDELHVQGKQYTACFLNMVYKEDCTMFTCGTKVFSELIKDEQNTFNLPSTQVIEAALGIQNPA
ncbi:hypothetical protein DFH28DRAFT_1145465 [Melampsora americana]|nr:hypothetical protein DFH28DRAFT_1145465 [Melampsora americana]